LDTKVLINLMAELAGLEEELVDARAVVRHHTRRDSHLVELQQEYAEDELAAARDATGAAVRLRTVEGEIRRVEELLARKQDQIIGISDRRQYRALETETAGLAAELDRLETAALELLGELEKSGEQAANATGDRRKQTARAGDERQRLHEEATRAAAAAEEIEAEIQRLQRLLPEGLARHHARLRQQYPTAVVRVQNGACGGCFGQLPAQQAIDAQRGKNLVRCASCARFVVHHSWQ
jgi:predicted  nucleic acid-binding Zn-ribbon protein